MHHSNFKGQAHIRRLALCGCVLSALFAGTTAHAWNRTWLAKPVISGTPATADTAGKAYSFTPSASGPRGHTLTFSISDKPEWASFNGSTGQLAGTPTSANVGRFANITISVSDGLAKASLAPFTITVSAPTSAPPTISGTAATTDTVGKPYSFTPTASGTNGEALSFSVQNEPTWATFSIANGTLSGTPTAANVGTFSNIVISVSNGQTSVSLPAFSITVSQPAATSGSATLTWTAPTTNTNGTALTDLAGYHIYYGTSPSAMSTVVDVANPGTTTYTISNLASGTWYFTVNDYTTSGLESALSNTGSKSIP